MAIYAPSGVPSKGNRNVWWVDAIADPSAPKVAEVTSTTAAIDISCYLDEEWDGPSASQDKDSDNRWCGLEFESMGDVKWTIGDMKYIVEPQAKDTTNGAARLQAFLAQGKRGFIVMRLGKDMNSAPTVGDKVDVYPAVLGASVPAKTAKNENLKNTQAVAVIGSVYQGVALAA